MLWRQGPRFSKRHSLADFGIHGAERPHLSILNFECRSSIRTKTRATRNHADRRFYEALE
jgi:hypothetical protein